MYLSADVNCDEANIVQDIHDTENKQVKKDVVVVASKGGLILLSFFSEINTVIIMTFCMCILYYKSNNLWYDYLLYVLLLILFHTSTIHMHLSVAYIETELHAVKIMSFVFGAKKNLLRLVFQF